MPLVRRGVELWATTERLRVLYTRYINVSCLIISVYVFLGSTTGLIEMMSAMESLQLFVKGEYMVIFVDMMTFSPKEALKYIISKYFTLFLLAKNSQGNMLQNNYPLLLLVGCLIERNNLSNMF